MKPPLILKEQDLLNKKLHKTKKFALNLKADLIAVLEFLIKNKKTLKIDLNINEHKTECGTYRCVSGWWAYWLGIPILSQSNTFGGQYGGQHLRYVKTFRNVDVFSYFYSTDDDKRLLRGMFFGGQSYGALPERLKLAESLKL